MLRRPVRILILLLTIAVTGGVVWRATVNEQARGRMRLASQQTDAAAADAIFELSDLRSSLYAYVAPGQGIDFWSTRAVAQLESVANRLRELEPAASAANHPLSTAGSSLDGLRAAEQRARAAIRDQEPLIAGDIVFTETRGLLDAAGRDLSDARQAMARAAAAREAGTANEQSLLAGGLIATWIFALVVLVPLPASAVAASDREALRRDKTGDPSDNAMGRPEEPVAADLPASPPPAAPGVTLAAPGVALDLAAPEDPEVGHDPQALPLLESAGQLCTAIARVANASELSPLLERAAGLLGARGIVVWLLAPDGQHLVPAMAHGYDERLLGRMGPLSIDAHNLTAGAFRASRSTHATADEGSPGAVAVPILSASGTSGVLAAEVPGGADLAQAEALATLLAAQLASLLPVGEPVSK